MGSRPLPVDAWENQPPCPKFAKPTFDWMGDDVCPDCGCVSAEIDAALEKEE